MGCITTFCTWDEKSRKWKESNSFKNDSIPFHHIKQGWNELFHLFSDFMIPNIFFKYACMDNINI